MTITVTKTHEEKIEVPLVIPSFWKENTLTQPKYRAVLDEKTYIQVMQLNSSWGHYEHILNADPKSVAREIEEAYNHWESVTEEEFMEVWDKAYSKMDLRPRSINPENYGMIREEENRTDTGSDEAYMELAKQDQL